MNLKWRYKEGDHVYCKSDDLAGEVIQRMEDLAEENQPHYVVHIFSSCENTNIQYAESDLQPRYKLHRWLYIIIVPGVEKWLTIISHRAMQDVALTYRHPGLSRGPRPDKTEKRDSWRRTRYRGDHAFTTLCRLFQAAASVEADLEAANSGFNIVSSRDIT